MARTPGEWDFACDSYGKVRHSKKACVFQLDSDSHGTIAARIENWSDAKLISAAPDLHDALQALSPMFDNDSPLLTVYADAIAACRAALTKANR